MIHSAAINPYTKHAKEGEIKKNINVSIPSKITTALTLNLYPNISKYILHIAL